MAQVSTFTRYCLNMQGYADLDDEAKSGYTLPLKFSPMVCGILIAVGLGLQSPIWLGVVAVVALIGSVLPSGHPVDLAYNLVIRHLLGARRLPPNPGPRRFACFVAALFLTGSALAFQYSMPVLGFALGGFLCAVSVVVILSNWCLALWMFGLMSGLISGRPKGSTA